MPDYLTTVTAETAIKINRKQLLNLCVALGRERKLGIPWDSSAGFATMIHPQSQYAIEWDVQSRELYIYAEDYANTSEVPQAFWNALAKVLTAKKLDFLEFGFASYCSKPCVGSFGGGEFRVYRDGTVSYANAVYPKHKIKDA